MIVRKEKSADERTWNVLYSNLIQSEKDIMKQLNNSIESSINLLSRADFNTLNGFLKYFDYHNSNIYEIFENNIKKIENLEPKHRTFREKLQTLENDITNLRTSSAQELEIIDGNIRKINDQIDATERRESELQTPAVRPLPSEQVFESPIAEFQSYLLHYGGNTGGWDAASHTQFLNKYQMYGADDIEQHLPNISSDSVRAHVEWYEQYLILKDKMKAAIKEIKEQKMKNSEIKSEIERPKVNQDEVKRNLEMRDKLKKQRQEEMIHAKEQQRLAEEEFKKKRYQEIIKNIKVNKPKPIVETPIEVIEQSYKPKFSQADWERLRQMNQAQIDKINEQKRKNELIAQQKAEKEMKIAKQTAKKFAHCKRDKERLLKPTSAMVAKQRKPDDEKTGGPVNSVFDIPRLGTPAWMR